jgi:hypothetical protein
MAFFARPGPSSAVKIVPPTSQDDKGKAPLRKGMSDDPFSLIAYTQSLICQTPHSANVAMS